MDDILMHLELFSVTSELLTHIACLIYSVFDTVETGVIGKIK